MMDEQTIEGLGHLQAAIIALSSYFAAQLVAAGINDLETIISDLEAIAERMPADKLNTIDHVVDALKKARPWGVIEGGKDGRA